MFKKNRIFFFIFVVYKIYFFLCGERMLVKLIDVEGGGEGLSICIKYEVKVWIFSVVVFNVCLF